MRINRIKLDMYDTKTYVQLYDDELLPVPRDGSVGWLCLWDVDGESIVCDSLFARTMGGSATTSMTH
jgi:hypothetical protein